MYDQQFRYQQMEQFGTNLGNLLRIRKLKKAGKMLRELGGISEKNINLVMQKHNLSGEAVKELVTSYEVLEQWKDKNKLEEPISEEIRLLVNKKTNYGIPEGMPLGQVFSVLKLLPPDKQKEWEGQFMAKEGGGGRFFSKKPGTVVDPDFTVPSQAGKKAETDRKITIEKLKSVKASLEKVLQSYNNIMSGVGVYVPDENKKELARQRKNEAIVHAKNYMAHGGTIQDLGYENLELLKLIFTGEDPVNIEPETETKSGGILEWLGLKKSEPTVEPDVEKTLAGKPPGRYKINGKVYKWNGTQTIQ